MMKFAVKAVALSVATLTSTLAMAEESKLPFPGTVSGNISVVSSYNLRGITNSPENSGAAVQGGLDYSHKGFYAGYWFSTLDYSYACLNPDCKDVDARDSFESDFYAGYKGNITEDLGYQVGGTIYYYYPGWESTGYETIVGLSYKDFGVTAQTLLNNVTFGNKGDTYFLATYAPALPAGFTGKAQLGAYYYGDDDEFTAKTEHSFAFRHATLGLSHALGDTGANWSLDYILGGYDRSDIKQKNKVVLGLAYAF
ncbi:hypothetical protein AYL20_15520 [Acinetobacter venetianus]|uniref:Porin n=2 Tax=Acinetobacter venetianus TaxID=52133 RepID=N9A4C1_ACIVR|nr:TorF family putative porin [Acinetobacter venetianus]ENV38908.1 hypothetical protein F959_00038 [Acinetobacter venetianus RAG-1 = CIP 110063]KXO81386.1 hypothetical protein AYL20_15520 [Acinetobacter venetianus]KXZ74097.1 hypothetical protein AVENLUH5627_00177 [Acinetobacter venetianus]